MSKVREKRACMSPQVRSELTLYFHANLPELLAVFRDRTFVDFAEHVRRESGLNVNVNNVRRVVLGFPVFGAEKGTSSSPLKWGRQRRLFATEDPEGSAPSVAAPAAASAKPAPAKPAPDDRAWRQLLAVQEGLLQVCSELGLTLPQLREFVPSEHPLRELVCPEAK